MNSKITNSQLSTTEPKKKKKANNWNRNRITEMEITCRVINREVGGGERGGKVQRISSINGRWKIDRGRLRIV